MARTSITQDRLKVRNLTGSFRCEITASDGIIVPSTFDPSTSNWTILTWFKSWNLPLESTPTGDHNLYSQQDGSGTGRSWLYIDRLNNNFSTFLSGSTQNFTLKMQDRYWYRLALVYNISTGIVDFYSNGEYVSSNSVTISSATGDHILGNNKALTGRSYGVQTDCRLYSRALSADEIRADYFDGAEISSNNLLFKFLFTEGSGSTTEDESEYLLTGTFNGSASWSTEVPCKLRTAIGSGRVAAAPRSTAL